jgi:hypothetical protein
LGECGKGGKGQPTEKSSIEVKKQLIRLNVHKKIRKNIVMKTILKIVLGYH